jgi:hypothetical protein
VGRNASGFLIADPRLFPNGLKAVVDYVHSKGLKFGIYTARGSLTCMGRPGSDGHEAQDAALWASWGVDYLKEDSCGGTTHGTMWEQYARMRDALNATGRPIYFSITQAQDWSDGHPRMHCYGDAAFSTLFWTTASPPLDPRGLANSYLVEYCNNEDYFGYTDGSPHPGGFLSNLDSQQLLTWDNMTAPGSWNDNDMLEVCHGAQSYPEYAAQFSTWAILASPLILGNDIRAMTPECLAIVANTEVIAVNQDSLGLRGKLVSQWPEAAWPAVDPPLPARVPPPAGAPPAPPALASLRMAPCTGAPSQLFSYDPSTRYLLHPASGACLTYGGYHEANFAPTACANWTAPDIGSQLWTVETDAGGDQVLRVVDNLEKVADVFDCNVTSPASVQVCTQGGDDCYSSPGGPPGCGTTGQRWLAPGLGKGAPSTIASAVGGGGACVTVAPLPPPPVDIRVQVWVKPLANGDVAFVMFNRAAVSYAANVSWASLGKPDGDSLALRDLWAHKDLGTFSGAWSALVAPHSAVMVRAAAAAPRAA